MKKECQCQSCINACWNSPGWFGSIEEVKGAAKIMNLSVEDFAEQYLIQEWWSSWRNHSGRILVPSPRRDFDRMTDERKETLELFPSLNIATEERLKNGPGFIEASWGHNLLSGYACIFLTEDSKCMIHESKPAECRELMACKEIVLNREKLVPYWAKRQNWFSMISNKIERKK